MNLEGIGKCIHKYWYCTNKAIARHNHPPGLYIILPSTTPDKPGLQKTFIHRLRLRATRKSLTSLSASSLSYFETPLSYINTSDYWGKNLHHEFAGAQSNLYISNVRTSWSPRQSVFREYQQNLLIRQKQNNRLTATNPTNQDRMNAPPRRRLHVSYVPSSFRMSPPAPHWVISRRFIGPHRDSILSAALLHLATNSLRSNYTQPDWSDETLEPRILLKW